MFYIWSGNNAPKSEGHVFHKFNQHILRNTDLPAYHNLRNAGIEGYYLNPENLQVQNYLLNLLHEIADTYDVSGIHLDYYRYPGVQYSFTAQSRTEFMLENYYDPWPVYQEKEQYSQDRGFENYIRADREYRLFLSNCLTEYLGNINRTIKATKPDIKISVAVKPDPVIARHRYFQDWRTWLKENNCDFIVLMNYRTDFHEFKTILDQLTDAELKDKIIVGISTYNQQVKAVQLRIDMVEAEKFAGFSLFSYNHLLKDSNYLGSLRLVN